MLYHKGKPRTLFLDTLDVGVGGIYLLRECRYLVGNSIENISEKIQNALSDIKYYADKALDVIRRR